MSKEDDKKKDDVNQNLNLDFEKAFEIFSTKLNTESRQTQRMDDPSNSSAMEAYHQQLIEFNRSGFHATVGKDTSAPKAPKNPLYNNTKSNVGKMIEANSTYVHPRMKIDIKTLQEYNTHKKKGDDENENNKDSEEKVIFMQ